MVDFINSSWFSGVVSGVFVALFNFVATKKKTTKEIEKLEAESIKIRLEAEKIRRELSSSVENIASFGYQLSENGENVLYDSSARGDLGFDFQHRGGRIYKNIEGKDVPVTEKGLGEVKFEKGIISIQRTNKIGRYELHLQRYLIDGVEKPFIPKDDFIEGKRSLKISFEAKVLGGNHLLKFVFKGKISEKWLASAERSCSDETWTRHDVFLSVKSNEDCFLRIDDQDISGAPSSVQIRNFVLKEKIS